MRMTIHSSNGRSAAGILLVASANVLRVAISGYDDTAVFWWVSGRWHRETGDPVEIEFLHDADESPYASCGVVSTEGATMPPYILAAERTAARAS